MFALIFVVFFTTSLNLTSGSTFPVNRNCDKVGVYCLDVAKQLLNYQISHAARPDDVLPYTALLFSMTVKRRFPNRKNTHDWVFWMDEELDGYFATVTFNHTKSDEYFYMELSKDGSSDVSFRMFAPHEEDPIPTQKLNSMIADARSGHDTFTMTTGYEISSWLEFEDQPMKVQVDFERKIPGTGSSRMHFYAETKDLVYIFKDEPGIPDEVHNHFEPLDPIEDTTAATAGSAVTSCSSLFLSIALLFHLTI